MNYKLKGGRKQTTNSLPSAVVRRSARRLAFANDAARHRNRAHRGNGFGMGVPVNPNAANAAAANAAAANAAAANAAAANAAAANAANAAAPEDPVDLAEFERLGELLGDMDIEQEDIDALDLAGRRELLQVLEDDESDSSDDDNEAPSGGKRRRKKRKTSKRKTSKRKTSKRKTSKRKTSKRKTSKRKRKTKRC
jgi:hypothetical protein